MNSWCDNLRKFLVAFFVLFLAFLFIFFGFLSSYFGSIFWCFTVKNNQSRQFSPSSVTHYRIELLLNLFNEHTFWSIVWTRFLSTFQSFQFPYSAHAWSNSKNIIEEIDGEKYWTEMDVVLKPFCMLYVVFSYFMISFIW